MLLETNSTDIGDDISEPVKTKFEKLSLAINIKKLFDDYCKRNELRSVFSRITPNSECNSFEDDSFQSILLLNLFCQNGDPGRKMNTINHSKTFLHLNSDKENLRKMLSPHQYREFIHLLDSIFNLKKNNFKFDCEYFHGEEMFVKIQYPNEYLEIDITIRKR